MPAHRACCCLWPSLDDGGLLPACKGFYFTGDGARRDAHGMVTITGRVDDVINVSGHRVGTAEVEAALASHGACIEAAVVGCAHAGSAAGTCMHAGLTAGTCMHAGSAAGTRMHARMHAAEHSGVPLLLHTPDSPVVVSADCTPARDTPMSPLSRRQSGAATAAIMQCRAHTGLLTPSAHRCPHDIKGEGIYAFVVLHEGESYGEAVRKDLVKTVREQIGAFAAPDVIHWTPGGRVSDTRPCAPALHAQRGRASACFCACNAEGCCAWLCMRESKLRHDMDDMHEVLRGNHDCANTIQHGLALTCAVPDRPAEDALREDHAARAAQDCHEEG